MTKVTKTITLSKPIDEIWTFLNDAEKVGRCLPGCQEVRSIDAIKSFWKIKVSAGIVSRVLETEVLKTADEQEKKINFRIRTKSGDLEGELQVLLAEGDGSSTVLNLDFDVRAVGAFSWFINQMVGKQSDKMADQFVACVNRSL